jgi:hypothetical protein
MLAKSILLLAGIWSIGLYFLICAINPLVPADISRPIRDYWLDSFAHGDLANNLGMEVLGLRGIVSLVPLIIVFIAALTALVFLSRSHGSGARPAR